MEWLEAIIRKIPFPVLACVCGLVLVCVFVWAVSVARGQDGTTSVEDVFVQNQNAGAVAAQVHEGHDMASAPEAGIAPRAMVVQGGGDDSEPTHEGHDMAGAPEAGIAPRATVVQGDVAASERAHEGHDMAGAAGFGATGFGDPLQDIVVAFDLVDRDGGMVRAEDFRGRHVLLGFGFTHCPAVCPMMALNMGRALKDTEADAVGIFVSVDTERDSPKITDEYASRFGERMLGLSGNVSQINAAATNFKVSYVVTKTQNNYTVQHSANVFLIDPDGRLVDVFSFSTPGEELAAAIR